MCVVSMVMDDFHRKWGPQSPYDPMSPFTPPGIILMTPDRSDEYPWSKKEKSPWPNPGNPLPKSVPIPVQIDPDAVSRTRIQITLEEWLEYQRLKQAAKEQDIREKNPDCQKPELEAWEKAFVQHLIKQGVIKPEHV